MRPFTPTLILLAAALVPALAPAAAAEAGYWCDGSGACFGVVDPLCGLLCPGGDGAEPLDAGGYLDKVHEKLGCGSGPWGFSC